MANATILNATTFTVAPVLSGANITSSTIPIASIVGTFADLGSNQTFTGIKTFTQQPVTNFQTSFASKNTMYGYLVGNALTSGTNNTIFGYNAGPVLTSSSDNVLIGTNAGAALTTSVGQNVFIGSDAGLVMTTGTGNVMIGNGAGKAKITGDNNVFIGSDVTHFNATAQSNCVMIGTSAQGTGQNITAIGNSANTSTFSNSTAIGQGAAATAANQVMLATATEYVHCPGTSAAGAIKLDGAVFQNMTLNTVSGATSGNLRWAQTDRGSAYKRVVIYCGDSAALVGAAVITFSTAFVKTPAVIVDSSATGLSATIVTSLTTTAATITGSSSTGFLFIEGY